MREDRKILRRRDRRAAAQHVEFAREVGGAFERKVALDAQRIGLGACLSEKVDLRLGFRRREFRFQFVLGVPQRVGFGVNSLAQGAISASRARTRASRSASRRATAAASVTSRSA